MTDLRVGVTDVPAGLAPRRAPLDLIKGAWVRHRDLLRNAGSLLLSTGVASGVGLLYWMLAARLFSQQAVGYGSAAVSAMTFLGTIGMFGLGTLMIGELPLRKAKAGLIAAALLACGLGALVIGIGFAIVAPRVNLNFARMISTPAQTALFAFGVAMTAVSLVFDQATIGLMRGELQLRRNVVFAVVKIVALPAAALVMHDAFGIGITLSWVVGMTLSMALLAARLWRAGEPILPRPDWSVLRGLGRTAMAHNWLNLALMMPFYILPVMVTMIVSPTANAAFYMATMLTTILFIVPTHLATVLFAVAAADPQVLARKLRFALKLSFGIGGPAMIVLIAVSHPALGLFGKGYTVATFAMVAITLGYPAAIPKTLYIAVCRASGKITRAATVLTTCTVAELAAATVGGVTHGLFGLSVALLAVRYAEALFTGPAVTRAAIGHGRHRRLETAAAAPGNRAASPAAGNHAGGTAPGYRTGNAMAGNAMAGNRAASPGPGNHAGYAAPGNRVAGPAPGNLTAGPAQGNRVAGPAPGNRAGNPVPRRRPGAGEGDADTVPFRRLPGNAPAAPPAGHRRQA